MYLGLVVLPVLATAEASPHFVRVVDLCDVDTIREKVNSTDERLRSADVTKKTCEELGILFNSIESRMSRCSESEKKRFGLLLDAGRLMSDRKCKDVLDSASREYLSCLKSYNHTTDQCGERLGALKDEYKEYSAGLTNSNDVCCAYHSYHKCLTDKLVAGCGDRAKEHTELLADKLNNKLLHSFCKNYETSVCVDSNPGARPTSSATASLLALLVVYLLCASS